MEGQSYREGGQGNSRVKPGIPGILRRLHESADSLRIAISKQATGRVSGNQSSWPQEENKNDPACEDCGVISLYEACHEIQSVFKEHLAQGGKKAVRCSMCKCSISVEFTKLIHAEGCRTMCRSQRSVRQGSKHVHSHDFWVIHCHPRSRKLVWTDDEGASVQGSDEGVKQ